MHFVRERERTREREKNLVAVRPDAGKREDARGQSLLARQKPVRKAEAVNELTPTIIQPQPARRVRLR